MGEQTNLEKYLFTTVTTNTHPQRVFSLFFSLNEGQRLTRMIIISNDDGVFNHLIKMKDYVKTTRSLGTE